MKRQDLLTAVDTFVGETARWWISAVESFFPCEVYLATDPMGKPKVGPTNYRECRRWVDTVAMGRALMALGIIAQPEKVSAAVDVWQYALDHSILVAGEGLSPSHLHAAYYILDKQGIKMDTGPILFGPATFDECERWQREWAMRQALALISSKA